MKAWLTLAEIRREYGELRLDESFAEPNPFDQFKIWFEDAITSEATDPTAMVLSTVDKQNHPDSRVVLLKGMEEESFLFYTNYESAKAIQLDHNPFAALNFYWPHMARQVRLRGKIHKLNKEQSDLYFSKRPPESQLAALASDQSREIKSREVLEQRYEALGKAYHNKPVPRPESWGGYGLTPMEMEFWQGRDNRLHDRLCYLKEKGGWVLRRLAP